jgi:prepilin-type N-terminal cleavage/methylation domain-containing protein
MRYTPRAFTLIELLVVMAIVMLITGAILANNSRFNSSVLLGSLAYDIALSVREAQVYGLSVQESNASFQGGYGVHFSASDSYVLFSDVNANKRYDPAPAGTDTIVQTYAVGLGHTVKSFCGTFSGNTTPQCSSDASPIKYLDIVFFRPNPDAIITSDKTTFSATNGVINPVNPYSSAQIVVTSPSGETRTISIQSTGQISVMNQ